MEAEAKFSEREDKRPLTGPPNEWTEACHRFWIEQTRLVSFIIFVTQLATNTDRMAEIARAALAKVNVEQVEKGQEPEPKRGGALSRLRQHRQLVLQMMLTRAADNFLAYLSDILFTIFRSRPEILRSRETITLEKVLEHTTMEGLVSALAERRVHQLSYQSFDELREYMEDKMGFVLSENADVINKMKQIIELRNLISHNRAIVNSIFKARLPQYYGEIGSLVVLEPDYVFDEVDSIASLVNSVDERAARKFGIERQQAAQLQLDDP